MGESEEPLNSKAHLLGCTSIAGFNEECQDMTRDLRCQGCGWGGWNVVPEVSWDPFLGCQGSVHRDFHGRYFWSIPHIVGHRFCRWESRLGCGFCANLDFSGEIQSQLFSIWSALKCQCWHSIYNVLFNRHFGFVFFAKGGCLWYTDILEHTSKSHSRGFLTQVSWNWYRSPVMFDMPKMIQFRLRNWWIWVFMVQRVKKIWWEGLFRLVSVLWESCGLACESKREDLSMLQTCSCALSKETRSHPCWMKPSRIMFEKWLKELSVEQFLHTLMNSP